MCLGVKGTPEDLYIAMGYIRCDFDFKGCNRYFKPWNHYNASKACPSCYDKMMEGQPFVDG